MRAVLLASSRSTREALLADLEPETLERLAYDWQTWARDDQLPPITAPGGEPWRTWLFLGGRGAGKTRAGAEWLRAQALGIAPLAETPARRLAVIGPSLDHVRAVMLDGVSGLFACHPDQERPILIASRNELQWPNGAIAHLYSADNPETLRGPQFEAAWCDELCRWSRPTQAWDNLQLALRLGDNPRAVVTTTPKAMPIFRRLITDSSTVLTRARTVDNSAFLSRRYIDDVTRRYGGTTLGQQELDGELIDAPAGTLWRRHWLDQGRTARAPEMTRIVVAVDPPVTSNPNSDACGIIAAGIGIDGRAYVLADRTVRGREPHMWARAAIALYRDMQADRIVAEGNQGGDLVASVLHQVDPSVPVKMVRATRSKWVRSEPVAALYAEGRVVHVGEHGPLEIEMLSLGPDGTVNGRSPDRVDALVWAITELLVVTVTAPTVRLL